MAKKRSPQSAYYANRPLAGRELSDLKRAVTALSATLTLDEIAALYDRKGRSKGWLSHVRRGNFTESRIVPDLFDLVALRTLATREQSRAKATLYEIQKLESMQAAILQLQNDVRDTWRSIGRRRTRK